MAQAEQGKERSGSRLRQWVDDRIPLNEFLDRHITEYPTPKNLNYWWNFGSLAGIFFTLQILTGLFIAFHYKPDAALAFDSVQRIMRDVNWGWLIRTLHATGATFFFAAILIHMFRGLYYGSYKPPRELLWWIGLAIWITMMGTAFSGYLLPWGQQSFWAAQVITNLPSAIPVIGQPLVEWLRGDFTVGDATLNRFYAMHIVLFPLIIGVLVVLHLSALHRVGSGNPTGVEIDKETEAMPFHPYHTYKDIWVISLVITVFLALVFYAPNIFQNPDNFIEANPLQTPEHIVPEWYLLAFFAILRSIPQKLLGVIALGAALIIFFFLPYLDRTRVRSATRRPIYRWLWLVFLLNFIVLSWVGANPAEPPFTTIGQVGTAIYFLFFLSLPLVTRLEGRGAGGEPDE